MSNSFGQTKAKVYLNHDHNYSTTYSYEVSEITIHSDSSYTLKSWNLINKKEWKKYKSNEPEISSGKITQNAEFLTLTEYRNENRTDSNWKIKVTDKRLVFYSKNKNGKLRKTKTYKRIGIK